MADLLELSRKNPFSNPLHKNVTSPALDQGARKLSCASTTGEKGEERGLERGREGERGKRE